MNRDYVKALSSYGSIGMLNNFKVYKSIAAHLETVLGGGYFQTLGNTGGQFKSSGFDYIANVTFGLSWNGERQLLNFRLGYEKTQHIESIISLFNWVYFL